MKTNNPSHTSILLTTALCLLIPLFALTAQGVAATDESSKAKGMGEEEATLEENRKVAKALEELLLSMEMKPFTYRTIGRGDPFLPFISDRVVQESDNYKPEQLTGMRRFEPGQLTLVAIMFAGDNPMAMVEDSSHKGYIVRKGTKIGKSGIISDILPNQVIIKQLSYSMLNKKTYKTVEMTLIKEGEK